MVCTGDHRWSRHLGFFFHFFFSNFFCFPIFFFYLTYLRMGAGSILRIFSCYAMLLCYMLLCYMLLCYAIMLCYYAMLLCYAIMLCYCAMLLCYAIVLCYCAMLLCYAIMLCYCAMLLVRLKDLHRHFWISYAGKYSTYL